MDDYRMKYFLTILFLFYSLCVYGYSDSFLEYIKGAENSVKSGYVDGHWYPHDSVEGGSQTIAYGHKIQKEEDFSQGLTEYEATSLLIRDIQIAENRAARLIKEKHSVEWSVLSEWKREIFIDFQFNGVLGSFPKFRRAVLCDDVAGIVREYKRYAHTANGKRIELKDRNFRLQQRYLAHLGFPTILSTMSINTGGLRRKIDSPGYG